MFDTRNLKEIDAKFLESTQQVNCQVSFYEGEESDFGHQLINKTIDKYIQSSFNNENYEITQNLTKFKNLIN